VNVAVVVQRYGLDINGGAELHARQIAEHLHPGTRVRVLTTCARDYVTWRNELPPGETSVNGVPVERYPVSHERTPERFAALSERTFHRRHSIADELRWLDSEGPVSPALLRRLATSGTEFDFVLLFSLRYHHAYHGSRALPDRAILVPTAEREPSIGVTLLQPVLRGVRAIMYNSPEERRLLQSIARNETVPGTVVGVGVQVADHPDPARFRQKYSVDTPYVLYVGRIDENKGCGALFDDFRAYARSNAGAPQLLLIGRAVMDIPRHPLIRHLGFVSDEDKFDALAGADVLLMPSPFESLSIVVLEAWALGRPVLVNARCEVLLGQCLRSNGGLFYDDTAEFCAALDALLGDPGMAAALGRAGRTYCDAEYSWPVVEQKYRDMFSRLQGEGPAPAGMEPLPGWWAQRRRTLPPAAAVVDAVATGPVLDREVHFS